MAAWDSKVRPHSSQCLEWGWQRAAWVKAFIVMASFGMKGANGTCRSGNCHLAEVGHAELLAFFAADSLSWGHPCRHARGQGPEKPAAWEWWPASQQAQQPSPASGLSWQRRGSYLSPPQQQDMPSPLQVRTRSAAAQGWLAPARLRGHADACLGRPTWRRFNRGPRGWLQSPWCRQGWG